MQKGPAIQPSVPRAYGSASTPAAGRQGRGRGEEGVIRPACSGSCKCHWARSRRMVGHAAVVLARISPARSPCPLNAPPITAVIMCRLATSHPPAGRASGQVRTWQSRRPPGGAGAAGECHIADAPPATVQNMPNSRFNASRGMQTPGDAQLHAPCFSLTSTSSMPSADFMFSIIVAESKEGLGRLRQVSSCCRCGTSGGFGTLLLRNVCADSCTRDIGSGCARNHYRCA